MAKKKKKKKKELTEAEIREQEKKLKREDWWSILSRTNLSEQFIIDYQKKWRTQDEWTNLFYNYIFSESFLAETFSKSIRHNSIGTLIGFQNTSEDFIRNHTDYIDHENNKLPYVFRHLWTDVFKKDNISEHFILEHIDKIPKELIDKWNEVVKDRNCSDELIKAIELLHRY